MGKDSTSKTNEQYSGTTSGGGTSTSATSDWMNQLQKLFTQQNTQQDSTSSQTQQNTQQSSSAGGFDSQQFMNMLQQMSQSGSQSSTGGSTQQQLTGVDAQSQDYISKMRESALSSLGNLGSGAATPEQILSIQKQFENPYTQQVLGGINQQYDQLRDKAKVDTASGATLAGAYGGSRHGVAEGERLAGLDREQMRQTGDVLSGAYDRALSMAAPVAQQQAAAPGMLAELQQRIMSGSLGPTGTTATGTQQNYQDMINQLMGTSTSGQTGGSSGTQYSSELSNLLSQLTGTTSSTGSTTGSQLGEMSTTGGSLTNSSGTQWGKTSGTSSGTTKQSNPWYKDLANFWGTANGGGSW